MAKNFYTIQARNNAWHTYAVAQKEGNSVSVRIDNYGTLTYSRARNKLAYYVEQAYRQLTNDLAEVTVVFDFRTK